MEFNVDNLMKTAFEEMENGQYADASKHFDMVVVNDSTNIDAPFFRAYCNCYDIRLGDMPNAATSFTNAFCRYVDAVKALNSPDLEKEKLDYAVKLLNELVSNYQSNSKRTMLTAPSVGLSLSTAATNMNTNCKNKLTSVNANVSAEIMEANAANEKSNNGTTAILLALIVLGVVGFAFWILWPYLFL